MTKDVWPSLFPSGFKVLWKGWVGERVSNPWCPACVLTAEYGLCSKWFAEEAGRFGAPLSTCALP